MSKQPYQRIPTSSPPRSPPPLPSSSSPQTNQHRPETDRPLQQSVLAEFNRPPPAWWKRILILLALVLMGWGSVKLGGMGYGKDKPQIIYASRYSEEFKYRPAASPVITEHLPDGRIRLRGATPGGVGVRQEDIPKSPAQIAADKERLLKEAREAAKKRLGLGRKRGKGKGKAKASRTSGEV